MKREQHQMPAYFRVALEQQGLIQSYNERPAYQKNDYIAWVERAT